MSVLPLADGETIESFPIRAPTNAIPLADVNFLAPVAPSKIVCVGRNYREHAAELGNKMPDEPLLFLKAPSAIIANGDCIELPPQSQQVEHEGELGVVIGRRARKLADRRRSAQLCSRLHLRQRRHCARPATQGRAVYARQVFRHILSGRSVHC